MKEKKLSKVIREELQLAMLGMEDMKYRNSSIPPEEVVNASSDAVEKKDVLRAKIAESEQHSTLKLKQQLKDSEIQREVLNQYKKELDKERKARKRAEEQQKELTYAVKEYSKRLKELEKRNQKQLKELERSYHKQSREMEKRCEKIETRVKKNARKQKDDMSSVKSVLKVFAYRTGLSSYGASMKEITKDCEKARKHLSEINKKSIEKNFAEIIMK